jgi:hypothetical protein
VAVRCGMGAIMALVGRAVAIGLAVAIVVAHAPARADQIQRNASAAWKLGDRCAQDAFKKFPDYTPESNAKREAARRACLRDHRLPEPGGAQATPPPAPDAAQ